MAGHQPSMQYPSTPWSTEQRIISRYNDRGLHAKEIAARERARNYAAGSSAVK